MSFAPEICVIIAAKDASATIGRALRSALREAEVTEVFVVDDGSADATAEAAHAADDGTGRLRIARLEANRGPAFARNCAIAHSDAPLVAILDADDFFLPGRFARLLNQQDWDLIADNIVFLDADHAAAEPDVAEFDAAPRSLQLVDFVDGNISKRGAPRGEIGFLKPVIRRDFLEHAGLRYREDLRLGEDYEFYVRALARGGRYRLVHGCGYGAVVRPDSLSGRHRTDDLKRLYEADRTILETERLSAEEKAAISRHERHVRARYELRNFLDIKAKSGLARAGLHGLANPGALPAIVSGIALDKYDAFGAGHAQPDVVSASPRYLLPAAPARKAATDPVRPHI
ncbi:MAG: glycosyltransferase family 2 protein [Hyphomicrobiales bacterium]|nr:glycosyltransferase family 2 protein [Hyphomicrobiales bacterium]